MIDDIFLNNHHFVYSEIETAWGLSHVCKYCESLYVHKNNIPGRGFACFWLKDGRIYNNTNAVVPDCNEIIIRSIIK